MASKRRLRRKACTGKVRHATVEAGQAHVYHLRVGRGEQGRFDVYRCRFCNAFHVGHSKGQRKLA